jgi:DNA-binding LacI/PurR family transcriptional regulator
MLENQLKIPKEWVIPDREDERDSFEEIPLPEILPAAFICNCDLTASRVIKALQSRGLRVPEDISVAGYDDYLYPGLSNVEITSYGVDMELMACTGIETLICKIEKREYQKGLRVIPGYLIEKQSVLERSL